MKSYDSIIIGFGKAGETLATDLADRNWKVAVIDRDQDMYGETGVDMGCIPMTVSTQAQLMNRPKGFMKGSSSIS